MKPHAKKDGEMLKMVKIDAQRGCSHLVKRSEADGDEEDKNEGALRSSNSSSGNALRLSNSHSGYSCGDQNLTERFNPNNKDMNKRRFNEQNAHILKNRLNGTKPKGAKFDNEKELSFSLTP